MTPGGPPNGHDQRKAYDDVLAHISHKRRKLRASSRRRGRRSVLASMFVVVGIGLGVLLIGTAVGGAVVVDDTLSGVSLDSLQQDPPGVNSRIYAADGSLLTILPSTENRTPVDSSQISPWLKQATVAIEDRRFYEHGGVDYQGVLRAALDNLEAGQIEQGGSTIEQQVVRNLYLSDEQSFTRKIREAYLAMQMSDRWTKDQILTEYLNIVPYGAITYGCEAAAQRYFDKSCKKPQPVAGGDARRHPPEPAGLQPGRQPAGREAAAQRRARRDAGPGRDHPAPARRRPRRTRSSSTPARSSTRRRRGTATSSRTCATCWPSAGRRRRCARAAWPSTPRWTGSCRTRRTRR